MIVRIWNCDPSQFVAFRFERNNDERKKIIEELSYVYYR